MGSWLPRTPGFSLTRGLAGAAIWLTAERVHADAALPRLEFQPLTSPAEASSVGGEALALLQVVMALALVSALAVLILRALARRGFGRSASEAGMQIEQRLALDPQQALLIVRVEGRRLLLASHRTAPARLLVELGPKADHGAPMVAANTPSDARSLERIASHGAPESNLSQARSDSP
jgi:flagellar biogenesis protein FliO